MQYRQVLGRERDHKCLKEVYCATKSIVRGSTGFSWLHLSSQRIEDGMRLGSES